MCATGWSFLHADMFPAYCGSAGELWYARVLSPPTPGAHHVVLTSPYVLIAPDLKARTAYLDRVVANRPGTSRGLPTCFRLRSKCCSVEVPSCIATHRAV